MNQVAVYIEGGGNAADGKAALRRGFDRLFQPHVEQARRSGIRWKTVLCGSRNDTFDAYQHAIDHAPNSLVVLLVDAESATTSSTPQGRAAHLAAQDHWDLRRVDPSTVHLMTQCMETWLVADADALASYYGRDFRPQALPKRVQLDAEPKASVYRALATATKDTQKGPYGKITHASDLLARIRADVVATRCTSFRQLTEFLSTALDNKRDRR